jgi:hypothetical protein
MGAENLANIVRVHECWKTPEARAAYSDLPGLGSLARKEEARVADMIVPSVPDLRRLEEQARLAVAEAMKAAADERGEGAGGREGEGR